MLSKNDLILLLTDLEKDNLNVSKYLKKVITSNNVSLDVLKFINDNRPLEIVSFYEHLRKNHNAKKSPLYKNIVVEELKNPSDAITILSALLLQISLFASKMENNNLFLKHSRASEIADAISNYYKTFDLIPSIKLLKLIKVDLKVFEQLKQLN